MYYIYGICLLCEYCEYCIEFTVVCSNYSSSIFSRCSFIQPIFLVQVKLLLIAAAVGYYRTEALPVVQPSVCKGAITRKIKHAIKLKTRLA